MATDGFAVMANTYGRLDFVANAAGVGLALAIHMIAGRIGARRRPA